MAKAPAFQMYAADIYMDTNEWSAEAFGIYNRLLQHQWVNGSIPKDIKTLAQISFVSIKTMSKRWPEMVLKFEFDEANRGRNIRLEVTRQKQIIYHEKQSEKGKKRADKMWEGHIATATTTAIKRLQPNTQPEDSSSSSTSSSSSKRQKNNNIYRAIPPKTDDIKKYCEERNNGINAEVFFDHYESRGWMIGKNKMKDWSAAIRTWERNNKDKPISNQSDATAEAEAVKKRLGL